MMIFQLKGNTFQLKGKRIVIVEHLSNSLFNLA